MVSQRIFQVRARTTLMLVLGGAIIVALLGSVLIGDLRAQGQEDVIHACASSNQLRLVSGPDDCRGNEQHMSWNVQGAEGPEGPQGPPGATDVNINVSDDGGVTQPLNGFIKFDGVDGEANEEDFGGWSRILAVEHEITNSADFGPGGGGGAGAASFAPITVVKELDRAVAALFQATPSGQHFQSVDIILVEQTEDGTHEYYQYALENVIIKRHNFGEPNPQNGLPLETLELAFEQITVTYTPLNADGSPGTPVSASWNVVQGTQ